MRWLSRMVLAAVDGEPLMGASGGCSNNARTLFGQLDLSLRDLKLEVRS